MGEYSRQAKTAARFWRRLLTGEEVVEFDNGEKSPEQVEMQVSAEVVHAKGASNIAPEVADRFEHLLVEKIEAELEQRGYVSVGLRYRPELDNPLGQAAAEVGLTLTMLLFPWSTWTRLQRGKPVIKADERGEEELPLLDA